MVAANIIPLYYYIMVFSLSLSSSSYCLFLSSFLSLFPCLSALVALQTQVAEPQNTYCLVSQMVRNSEEMEEVTTHTHILLCLL